MRLHLFILSTTPYENVMWNTASTDRNTRDEFLARKCCSWATEPTTPRGWWTG